MTTREKLNHIVFGTDTKAGKLFDVILLWIILPEARNFAQKVEMKGYQANVSNIHKAHKKT